MNNDLSIVACYDKELFSQFTGRRLVVLLDSPDELSAVLDDARKRKNMVTNAVVHLKTPLSSVLFSPDWSETGLSFYLETLDPITYMIKKAKDLRSKKVMIFLPVHDDENLTTLRILSSLGIPCGFYFESAEKPVNWDKVDDLLYYHVYSRLSHGPIQPFESVLSRYRPKENAVFHSVYFDDPSSYIHMDSHGNLALNRWDLERGAFIGQGLSDLDSIRENPKYTRYMTLWQGFFTGESKCGQCSAWRICQGVFLDTCEKDASCTKFMTDLIEAGDYRHKSQKRGSDNRWR
jgi:hypothetical protein